VASNLDIGFALDRRWHLLRGEMERSKKTALIALARVLATARVPYAIIGGIAVQVHRREPRTTLDIDVAIADLGALPRQALVAAGFTRTGSFADSENSQGPEQTPVQFTADVALAAAVSRAGEIDLDGTPLRVVSKIDLLRQKLRAGSDPARRRSKQLQDLADAQALVEDEPALLPQLTEDERAILQRSS
jgi:hypothetical protein